MESFRDAASVFVTVACNIGLCHKYQKSNLPRWLTTGGCKFWEPVSILEEAVEHTKTNDGKKWATSSTTRKSMVTTSLMSKQKEFFAKVRVGWLVTCA